MHKILREDQQMHLIQYAEQFTIQNISLQTNRDHNPPRVPSIYKTAQNHTPDNNT
jgi:hypothetical protein